MKIVLISDIFNDPLYLTRFVGFISNFSKIQVYNLSKNISPLDFSRTQYILTNNFDIYPQKTIFVAITQYDNNPTNEILLGVFPNKKFLICLNNGLISSLKPAKEIFCYSYENDVVKKTSEIIGDILKKKYKQRASIPKKIEKTINIQPAFYEKFVLCHVVYIDYLGNCITNLDKHSFEKFVGNNNFKIVFKNEANFISHIDNNYENKEIGDFIVFFNEFNKLTLGLYNANFAQNFDIQKNSTIRIEII